MPHPTAISAPRPAAHHGPARHPFSHAEEIANSAIHGAGFLLSIVGLVVLISMAAWRGGPWEIVSCALFGSSLVLLYGSSSLYHALPVRRFPRTKHFLRSLDQSAIYLLIAGSYAPFTLITLRGPLGWTVFGGVTATAIVGIVLQFALKHRSEITQTGLYLGMGWASVAIIVPLISTLPALGVVLLVAGGLAYTIGIVFYAWRSLPYHHAIWHAFVLAGSVCHWFAVSTSVLPGAPMA
jgi:hemolysin III